MNHRKHLKRARKQGAKDWAKRVAPVYLEQIAEVCRERGAAQQRVRQLDADVAKLRAGIDDSKGGAQAEADRTLGRLVRAMPDGAELLKGGGWQVTVTYDTPDEDVIASGNTPEEALRAAGITLPEETAANGAEEAGKP